MNLLELFPNVLPPKNQATLQCGYVENNLPEICTEYDTGTLYFHF